jgi:hypothetical protein
MYPIGVDWMTLGGQDTTVVTSGHVDISLDVRPSRVRLFICASISMLWKMYNVCCAFKSKLDVTFGVHHIYPNATHRSCLMMGQETEQVPLSSA